MTTDDKEFRVKEKGKAEDAGRAPAPRPADGPVRETNQAPKDHLAIGVFVLALVALFVTGYLGIRAVKKDLTSVRPSQLVSKWLSDLEEYGMGRLGERMRKVGPEQKRAKEAQRHIIVGYNFLQKNRFTSALKAFDKAIEIDPQNPEAYFWRGQTLIKTGQYEKAIVDFKGALTRRPDYVEAYEHLGWILARMDNCEESVGYLTKAIELKPENGWAYHNRGHCYFKLGNREKALEDAKRACELRFEEGCKAYEEYQKRGAQ